MLNLLLQAEQQVPVSTVGTAGDQFLLNFLGVFFFFIIIFLIATYIYMAIAFVKIARKTKTEKEWMAWIPIVGTSLLSAKIAKMHWWPILFLPVAVILFIIGFLFIQPGVSPDPLFYVFFVLGILLLLPLSIYSIIWGWKVFEAVGRPGWWIILSLIPYVGGLLYFIFLGIAAWGDNKVKK